MNAPRPFEEAGPRLQYDPDRFDEFVDQNEFWKEGLLIKSGSFISYDEIEEKAPIWWESEMKTFSEKAANPNARNLGNWFVATEFESDCDCGTQNCPTLGQELKGRKGSSWIQVANAPSSNPFADMYYSKDVKSLTNYSGHHNFAHYNYNSKGLLTMYFYYDIRCFVGGPCEGQTPGIYIPDVDGPIQVGDNGVVNWFKGWNETLAPFQSPDENAIIYQYRSCSSCDACN